MPSGSGGTYPDEVPPTFQPRKDTASVPTILGNKKEKHPGVPSALREYLERGLADQRVFGGGDQWIGGLFDGGFFRWFHQRFETHLAVVVEAGPGRDNVTRFP